MSSARSFAARLANGATALERWFLHPTDGRIYAIVRATYAFASLCVLIELWPYREQVFTTGSLVPRFPVGSPLLPLHYLTSPLAITITLSIAIAASLLLMAGVLRRLAIAILWLWTFSYGTIAYPIDSGYDGVLRAVGFVLLVSPTLGGFSLRPTKSGAADAQPARYGLRLLQFQFCVLYVATLWFKAPDPFWRNGELMAYFMMSMYSRYPSPEWAEWGRLSVVLTWSTLVIEGLLPVLVWKPAFRRFALLLGLMLHVGIGLTSTIGLFTIAMLPLYASFLESADIDAALQLAQRLRARFKPSAASA